ncbi:MAG TPA: hypothetical protein PLS08_04975, partial [Chryseolinea sp.]|nr:hypothetical protein [Chryseolinea sp.]
MKHATSTLLIAFLFASTILVAQKKQDTTPKLSFPDSIRLILENTRNVDAGVIGSTFATSWTNSGIGINNQITIQKQTQLMRKKKYAIKPYLVNYFGAIANAVTIEKADDATVTAFLRVAGKVIENETSTKANAFFSNCRTFFEHHALHYEKTFRLYSSEDEYTFDYIEPPAAFDYNDTTTQITEAVVEEDDNWDDEPTVDSIFVDAPLWANPPPQPILEGPVIRFSRVSLTFVTRYDSVTLKNSKGSMSLRDDTFVGEEGKFDWTSAGLSADSVYCTFTQYNFNAKKPELKSDLVKLNYVGKTPGFIPGTFEFKSQARKDSIPSTYPRFKSFQSSLRIQGIGDENISFQGGFSLTGNKTSSANVSGDFSKLEVSREGEKKFTARSADFLFTDSTIAANNAMLSIVQRNDSISHPAVRLKYFYGADSTQRLYVQKDKGALKHTPYSATFFNVDFATDIIKWDLFSDSMDILTDGNRNTVPLIIESVDFYDPEDFRLLKGQGFSFHPLALVAKYCITNNTRELYSGDLTQFSGKDYREIKSAIQFLSEKGMITYNPKTDIIHVKEKAITVYKASLGQMDYDNLKIHSVIDSSANATLNLKKGYITVRGVDE